jgi:spore coat polysaccharide biosynthesis predicted glycosyltransferase SpsG
MAKIHLFLLGDLSGHHLVDNAQIEWTDCQSDVKCAEMVLIFRPNVIVFDTLNYNKDLFCEIAKNATTVSLSPIFSCLNRVDYLFHRTVYEDPVWSESETFPTIYKGLEYSILPVWLRRITTKRYREYLNESKLSIAISMGGTDVTNRTLALLKKLSRHHQQLVIWVALGDAYTHSYEELLRCANENRQEIILLKSNESMWRVLKNTSLVICSGGLTTYESAYVGIPSINILQNTEWAYLFDELVDKDVAYVLNPSENVIEKASDLVFELVGDRDRLVNMHKLSKHLIASGGAQRIAKKILKTIKY